MAQGRAAPTDVRDVEKDFDTLRSDLDTLRKDFTTLVSTLKDTASSRAEAELNAVRQRVATFGHDLQATGQQQLRSAEMKIGEQPLMSVVIAFATGLVVGRLMNRD